MSMEKKIKIGLIGLIVCITLVSGWFIGSYSHYFFASQEDKIIVISTRIIDGTSPQEHLSDENLALVGRVKGVNAVGGLISKVAKVEFGDEIKYSWISGIAQDESNEIIRDMQGFEIESGRDLKEGDTYRTVIGNSVTHTDFFKNGVLVGDSVEINDQKFEVVGTLDRVGNPQDDQMFTVPLETAREIFGKPDELTLIIANTKPGFDISYIAEEIKNELRKVKGENESFQVWISSNQMSH